MTHTPNQSPPQGTAPQKPAVSFDWQEFGHHLDDSDLTDDQKRAFIETMWSIVVGFVDLGFDVRTPSEICGQAPDLGAALQAAVIPSDIPNQAEGDTP